MFNSKNKIGKKKGSKLYISQKAYSNPYFKEVNKTSRSTFVSDISWKAKIYLLLILIVLSSVFWFVFYSKYFLIYDLNINIEKINDIGRIGEGEIEKMTREELRSKFVFLPGNNIFLFDENKLYNRISEEFAFEEINVSKKLPNKLIINLREVSYALVWKEQEKYYYITVGGDIINEVSPEEVKEIFPVIDNKGRDLILDGAVRDKNDHLEFAIKLYKNFKDTNIFNIESFIIGNQNDSTLTMKIFEGPEIYFNVTENIDTQSEKLLLLKNEKLRGDLYSKTYIDLRFGDMIYYR